MADLNSQSPNILFKSNKKSFLTDDIQTPKSKRAASRRDSQVLSTTNLRAYKDKESGNKMINQYKKIKTLGKGGYATVSLCQDTKSSEYYAMKQMNKKNLKKQITGKGQNAYMYVIEELKVL